MLGCSESDGDLGKTDPMMKRFPGIGIVNSGSLAEVIGEPGMVSPPQLVDELGSRDPYDPVKITQRPTKASWNKPVMP
ncbi:hypothetical protein THAOC_18657 [Thalassiosira oceanica]|uniref:Uncharacterized protein n=1 Tax=Thalassiosira oceanica TaxID=159749 RepID=K0S6L7_THAOC|nr:hypothetical protein THAOC_18657 [Thalassiosira oceanica]|eukprot:EJK60925.1 hypothetical protein THAOC_18657 [Thalassiosira oceanica]